MSLLLVIGPDSPCGCGSGRRFGECHLVDGSVQVEPKEFNPPMPMTGESMKKCYFAFTNNCGGRLSREHIISQAVLRNISSRIIAVCFRDEVRRSTIVSDSLTVRRMCARHNSAFSRLDTEAGRLFNSIQTFSKRLSSSAGETETCELRFFHRTDIERWLLKTLLNIYYSRMCGRRADTGLLKNIGTLFDGTLRAPYGLYMAGSWNQTFSTVTANEISFTLTVDDGIVTGVQVILSGIEFNLLIAGTAVSSDAFLAAHIYRPKTLSFSDGERVFDIYLVWENGSETTIAFSPSNPIERPEGILE